MKRIFLIVTPYLIFCTLFTLFLIVGSSKKCKNNKQEKEIANTDSAKILIDSLSYIEDSLQNYIQNQENQIEDITDYYEMNLSQEGRFKLIIGSFQVKDKADRLYMELKCKGYNPFFIGGPYNSTRVCAGTGNTSDELAPLMISLREDGYNPWILESY